MENFENNTTCSLSPLLSLCFYAPDQINQNHSCQESYRYAHKKFIKAFLQPQTCLNSAKCQEQKSKYDDQVKGSHHPGCSPVLLFRIFWGDCSGIVEDMGDFIEEK